MIGEFRNSLSLATFRANRAAARTGASGPSGPPSTCDGKKSAPIWVGLLLAILAVPSPGRDLYSTDFESFPVGDNLWGGTEGWMSTDLTSGSQGIVEDFTQLPLGKTAYLGFEPPTSPLTRVFRPIGYDPAPSGVYHLEFESFLGILDSANGQRDQFFISFYDASSSGRFLAALLFDNSTVDGDIFRWRGKSDLSIEESPTGLTFPRGEQTFPAFVALQILKVEIDLAANTWSAHLDGIPAFTDASFTDPAYLPLTLGSVAAEWELTDPAAPGDNWLFVADWFVRTAPQGADPFLIESISESAAGEITITWQGDPGYDYHVEYSSDLQTWHTDLPGANFPGITSQGPLSFTDTDVLPEKRFYRVGRQESP